MTTEALTTALTAVRDLRAKVVALEQARREPIAITGIGCRLPGEVSGPADLWRLLVDGVDAITEIPASRWDNSRYYHEDREVPGRMTARHGGFLSGAEEFDPYFFGISPREAQDMDPQQRLFLEVAWEAVEDAGLTLPALQGTDAGVFVAANACDFLQMQLRRRERIGTYTSIGAANSLIPNRLSYLLDLHGPSLTIDSACSASLVAVHLAAQSLRAGECPVAVVGGMNLMLSPATTMGFSKIGALAEDGRCKTFDSRADGYVRGEGVIAIVLKRLSDAVADGDRIWAVLAGSAVNQDGLTNGVTAPNGLSQRNVIRRALANARIEPHQVTLVEAHGTGTALGDPIEVEALSEAYGRPAGDGDPGCAIGSIKTNIGHLEAGSGLAGLVKAALSVHHRAITPNLHFTELNPYIELDGTRLFIPTATAEWDVPDDRRYAAVSAFGAGGTNAHVILGPAPAPAEAPAPPAPGPVALSVTARTADEVGRMAAAHRDHLLSPAGRSAALRDIAATAALRRTAHPHRLAVVADSHEQAAARLTAWLDGEHPAGVVTGRVASPAVKRRTAFLFAGHGTQRLGMGRQLMGECEVFRAAVQACDEAIRHWQGESVIERIHRTDLDALPDDLTLIQPALFAVGVGLAARWRSLGIEPDVVAGHSMGEITAACVAGALSLEDAAQIITLRSRLLTRLQGSGSLMVVGLPLDEADALLDGVRDVVSVAVSNSPTSTVLSGDTAVLTALGEQLAARRVFHRLMKNSVPGHGPSVDRLREDLLDGLADLTPRSASVPILSTTTGAYIDGSCLDAEYWYENLRRPVLFWPTVRSLVEQGHDTFVEVSPHPLLLSAVEQAFEEAGREGLGLASMRREEPESEAMLTGLAALHAHGHPVPPELLAGPVGTPVPLPSYTWRHERFPLPPVMDLDDDDPAAPVPAAAPAAAERPADPEPAAAPTADPAALPADAGELAELVRTTVAEAVARELGFDLAQLDPTAGFFQLGMDSIMAVRIKRRLEDVLHCRLATPAMFEHPTVDALTAHLLDLVGRPANDADDRPALGPDPAAPRTTPEPASPAQPDASLDEASESELLAILAGELGSASQSTDIGK
ncbi:beta-ketoacyl synthase N-terminal-like domain-containing protein [Kitasatospora sp. NPDC049285]|uniref:type I polyketide synthase n=1 Tax=Kitasatospora sp. NPDC049285 TaxID=3157096 RepID=UPI00342CA844